MGKKGGITYLKRLNTPGFWKIHKKEYKYTPRPSAGPHPNRNCFTLTYIVRDLLKLSKTARETKKILNERKILVDGKARIDPKFPVGLMDVIEIPDINAIYRLVPDPLKKLKLAPITKDQEYKLCKIKNKNVLKNGAIQLNLHDGKNVLIQVSDPHSPKEDVYKVNDVVKVNLSNMKIEDHVKFEEGKFAVVHAGINIGRSGNIVTVIKQFGPNASRVTLDDQGVQFDTALDFVMVLGEKKPIIEIPI
ncbi:MAG: 30S ribosomal protein S4e [Promethearchaeota archaeon]